MIGNSGRKRRPGRARVLGAVLVAGGLGAALVAVTLAAPHREFLHLHKNLSRTQTRISSFPDVTVSPDGDRIAVVWREEYRDNDGSKGHVFLRAASEAGGGWGNEAMVYEASSASLAIDARVAVTGTTAHVIYALETTSYFYVYHKTCDLTVQDGDPCITAAKQVAKLPTSSNTLGGIDVVLDGDGVPHVVWSQFDGLGDNGQIYYARYGGSSWGTVGEVSDATDDNYRPAIAWSNGYVHVVWVEESSGQYHVRYKRRADDASSGDPWINAAYLHTQLYAGRQGTPDVAARGERVFVVWDYCDEPIPSGYCELYSLVYLRSNTVGSSWLGNLRDVGTDSTTYQAHASSDNSNPEEAGGRGPYRVRLQPAVALNDAGWPAVVWHEDRSSAKDGSDYAVYYTYAISGASQTVTWTVNPPQPLNRGQPSKLGAPAVGLAGSGEEQNLHVVYMQDTGEDREWDVYYDSNEWEDLEHLFLPITLRGS